MLRPGHVTRRSEVRSCRVSSVCWLLLGGCSVAAEDICLPFFFFFLFPPLYKMPWLSQSMCPISASIQPLTHKLWHLCGCENNCEKTSVFCFFFTRGNINTSHDIHDPLHMWRLLILGKDSRTCSAAPETFRRADMEVRRTKARRWSIYLYESSGSVFICHLSLFSFVVLGSSCRPPLGLFCFFVARCRDTQESNYWHVCPYFVYMLGPIFISQTYTSRCSV